MKSADGARLVPALHLSSEVIHRVQKNSRDYYFYCKGNNIFYIDVHYLSLKGERNLSNSFVFIPSIFKYMYENKCTVVPDTVFSWTFLSTKIQLACPVLW